MPIAPRRKRTPPKTPPATGRPVLASAVPPDVAVAPGTAPDAPVRLRGGAWPRRCRALAVRFDAVPLRVDALPLRGDALPLPVDALARPVDPLRLPVGAWPLPVDDPTLPVLAMAAAESPVEAS